MTDGLTIELDSEDDTTRLGCAIAELARAWGRHRPGRPAGSGQDPAGAGNRRSARRRSRGDFEPDVCVDQRVRRAGFRSIMSTSTGCRDSAAFLDLGIADYWGGEGLGLVEWADRVRDLMPEDSWWIRSGADGPTSRVARFEAPRADAGLADRLAKRLA